MEKQGQKTVVRTVCGMPDFLRCGLLVELSDGVITKVRPTDPDDPTAGRICSKGLSQRYRPPPGGSLSPPALRVETQS
jgi:anaerobic selenocysteine-containing dehydrogenase